MLKLNDFLNKVNVIVNSVETKDTNYKITFVDFDSETLAPNVFMKNSNLINKLHIDDDFQPLYNEILSKLITSSELNKNNNPDIKDKFDINVNDMLYHDVTKTEDENKAILQRRIIAKINNASNFIAAEGRIGPAQYIVLNKNNKDYVQPIIDFHQVLRVIFDNSISDDNILLGRKNCIDQPTTNLVYYIDNDIFYYDIAETGKYYFKQYFNVKLYR